jgi:hypothetical protein
MRRRSCSRRRRRSNVFAPTAAPLSAAMMGPAAISARNRERANPSEQPQGSTEDVPPCPRRRLHLREPSLTVCRAGPRSTRRSRPYCTVLALEIARRGTVDASGARANRASSRAARWPRPTVSSRSNGRARTAVVSRAAARAWSAASSAMTPGSTSGGSWSIVSGAGSVSATGSPGRTARSAISRASPGGSGRSLHTPGRRRLLRAPRRASRGDHGG